jgi:hypothetical protein
MIHIFYRIGRYGRWTNKTGTLKFNLCKSDRWVVNIQSDQQETKSRVLPHLLFYRNVRSILIRHFYIIAVHSFCWLPTSQKSIINCLYKLFVIHE